MHKQYKVRSRIKTNKGKVLRRYWGGSTFEYPHQHKADVYQTLFVFTFSIALSLGALAYGQVKPADLLSPIPAQAYSEFIVPELADIPEPNLTKWEEFTTAVDKVAPMYNFPKNVVLAQGALESTRGNSKFAKDRNNFLGIGAYDADPNQAFHYENAEQCVIEYMRLIKRNFPEAWANRDNPEALLKALKVNEKGNMYATDPNYVQKIMSMREWKY